MYKIWEKTFAIEVIERSQYYLKIKFFDVLEGEKKLLGLGEFKSTGCSDFNFENNWTHICCIDHFAEFLKYLHMWKNNYFNNKIVNCARCSVEFDRYEEEYFNVLENHICSKCSK